jgi:hypothetical protein
LRYSRIRRGSVSRIQSSASFGSPVSSSTFPPAIFRKPWAPWYRSRATPAARHARRSDTTSSGSGTASHRGRPCPQLREHRRADRDLHRKP